MTVFGFSPYNSEWRHPYAKKELVRYARWLLHEADPMRRAMCYDSLTFYVESRHMSLHDKEWLYLFILLLKETRRSRWPNHDLADTCIRMFAVWQQTEHGVSAKTISKVVDLLHNLKRVCKEPALETSINQLDAKKYAFWADCSLLTKALFILRGVFSRNR